MLFFIDESWQTISGQAVGALGAVAVPQNAYNAFCAEVFSFKREVLGARELTDSEIKGERCFARSAFKRQALHGDSYWLQASDRMFNALERHGARVFAIYTRSPHLLTLHDTQTTALSQPYKQLIFDFLAFMRHQAPGPLGSLSFDQRGLRQDEAAAATISNYFFRARAAKDDLFTSPISRSAP